MSKHPGLYSDIGKKARDLLYKGYGQKPPVRFHNELLDLHCDVSFQIEDIIGGFGTEFKLEIPSSGQVELQYLREYAGISGSLGLAADPLRGVSPVLGVTGVVGHPMLSIGSNMAFNVLRRTFYMSAGLNFTSSFLVASLTFDKPQTVTASCYTTFFPLRKTAIAAEYEYNYLMKETCFTIGTEHAIQPSLLVKTRANTRGEFGALVRRDLGRRFFLAVAGEIDSGAAKWVPKVGVSVAVKS